MISAYRTDGEKISCCVYLDGEGCFVSILPGVSDGEYIRLQYHETGYLYEWLRDMEILADGISAERVLIENDKEPEESLHIKVYEENRVLFSYNVYGRKLKRITKKNKDDEEVIEYNVHMLYSDLIGEKR